MPTNRFNVMVPMRDETRLATDLYFPGGEGPWPAIVTRTPYNKTSPALSAITSAWNAKGYAFVTQDARGRGDSEGEFTPYENEGRDGHDTIEWIAQQDWCDGNVALFGGSYGARSGWFTALEQPEHLVAMVILVSPSDPFVEWPTSDMTPMMVSWHRLVSGRVLQNVQGIDWTEVYEHLPLIELDVKAGFDSPSWKDSLSHPTLDDHLKARRYQTRFEELDIPVLHVSGWYDDEQIGTPLNFVGMSTKARSQSARDAQRLLMGPWGHGVNAGQKLGEVDFGPTATIDLWGYAARWLDARLGRGDDDVPRVRIFVMGSNEWRDEAEWPPARTRYTDFFLHSGGAANSRFGDGRLSTAASDGDEPSDAYTYDPARPVPFITDLTSSQLGGPDDYSAIAQRGDVLCYTSAPLEFDTEVTGPIKLVLFASSSAVDTDFTGMLIDVHPTGFWQRLCDGVVRARFREGFEQEVLMEPGTVYEFEIDLWNTSQVFKAGHRIGLLIASSAFPKYDRNLNTGEPIATATRMVQAENSVFHDASHPSRLVLPLIGDSRE